MRTSTTKQELKTFTFPMTDQDVLDRVGEINKLKEGECDLRRKLRLIQQEIKSNNTEVEQMFDNIVRREEPREIECEVLADYKHRIVEDLFEGEVMASRKMSEWEYSNRPEDIYPSVKAKKDEEPTDTAPVGSLKAAADRAEEIVEKTTNMEVTSGDTNAYSEAKTETMVEGLNV